MGSLAIPERIPSLWNINIDNHNNDRKSSKVSYDLILILLQEDQ